jgi:putative AbiEi antitoxin of type IV toxin-antitoxin system
MKPTGLSAISRSQLSKLLRDSPPIVTPGDAATALGLTPSVAARRLAAWSRSGWLARVRRGAYVPVPIESESADVALDDPWSVATAMFAPCYVGGWSAAEHWGLGASALQRRPLRASTLSGVCAATPNAPSANAANAIRRNMPGSFTLFRIPRFTWPTSARWPLPPIARH